MSKRERPASTVAQALRTVRQRRGISQERLALKVGVARTYVGRIERRTLNPTMASVANLLRALGATWVEIGTVLDGIAERGGGCRES